ncbi:MAG: mechanosensitive ion channel [Muribaculaceae bacterium]|nr:mechanosensitive ion channel [Muribaculaceae bacterium]
MNPLQLPVVPVEVPDSVPSVKEEVAMLKSLPLDDLLDKFVNYITTFAINLAIALIVFYVGKFVIKKIYGLLTMILNRRHIDASLTTFVLSMVKMLLYFILIVTVIGILGIETSSFIALFASAGVAIGMALSGTLQNFAGGVLILLLKPYRVGDYIEAQGFAGTVKEIQIFHTIITTYDNKAIIIPNGGLSTGSVNNWSREDYRRVDWTVSISYSDSVDAARKRILELLNADQRVVKRYIEEDRQQRAVEQARRERSARGLDEAAWQQGRSDNGAQKPGATAESRPWYKRLFRRHEEVKEKVSERVIRLRRRTPRVDRAPVVVVDQLADSAVVLKARAWTQTKNYWDVYYSINERIFVELPEAGIHFPFPQMDVHLSRE